MAEADKSPEGESAAASPNPQPKEIKDPPSRLRRLITALRQPKGRGLVEELAPCQIEWANRIAARARTTEIEAALELMRKLGRDLE